MAVSENVRSSWEEMTDGGGRVVRGVVAGLLGGLFASWAMNVYQQIEARPVSLRRREQALADAGVPAESIPTALEESHEDDAQATVKVARAVSRKLFEHELTPSQEKLGGPAVQFAFGGLAGALYGGLAEVTPAVAMGFGIPYATVIWLGKDEIGLPAAGLTQSPTQKPAEAHASALATHFVYGISLDISRRILLRLF